MASVTSPLSPGALPTRAHRFQSRIAGLGGFHQFTINTDYITSEQDQLISWRDLKDLMLDNLTLNQQFGINVFDNGECASFGLRYRAGEILKDNGCAIDFRDDDIFLIYGNHANATRNGAVGQVMYIPSENAESFSRLCRFDLTSLPAARKPRP